MEKTAFWKTHWPLKGVNRARTNQSSVSAVICESCCDSVTARGSRLGISAGPWVHHRYIDSVIYLVPLHGTKSAACWKPWSDGRSGDGGITPFCFFW